MTREEKIEAAALAIARERAATCREGRAAPLPLEYHQAEAALIAAGAID